MGSPCQATTTVPLDLVGLFPVPEIRFLTSAAQVPNFGPPRSGSPFLSLRIPFAALSEGPVGVQNWLPPGFECCESPQDCFPHLFSSRLRLPEPFILYPSFADCLIAHTPLPP